MNIFWISGGMAQWLELLIRDVRSSSAAIVEKIILQFSRRLSDLHIFVGLASHKNMHLAAETRESPRL